MNGINTDHDDTRVRSLSWEKRQARRKSGGTGCPHRDLRIAVTGPRGVGKSALVVRFLTKRFIGDYAEEESVHERLVAIDDSMVCVTVWDTVPSPIPRDDYMCWADGVVLVFSLTNIHSFRQARAFGRQLLHATNHPPSSHGFTGLLSPSKPKSPPTIVLVGNKSDMAQSRQVTVVQARELAASLRCPYLETSARDSGDSVQRAFATVCAHIRLRHQNDAQNNNTSNNKKHFGFSSTLRLAGLKQHLKSLTEFRSRTNTF